MNAPADSKKKALLNDTPSANVYSQLQKLAQQNPTCKPRNPDFSSFFRKKKNHGLGKFRDK